jgi:hypothetical protein
MNTLIKSPKNILLRAYRAGQHVLPPYAHRFSPHTFTQAQLFACLVLKTFLKTDYRGIAAILEDCSSLRRFIHLKRTPHFTTLQKVSQKVLKLPIVNSLLYQSVKRVLQTQNVALAAIDSTGLESGHISSYFVRRRSRVPNLWQTTTYTRFPKLAVIGDCKTHLILGAMTARGPGPDVHQFIPTLSQLNPQIQITTLLADAGYDSERNHRYAREIRHIKTWIPPHHGRPTTKPPTGKYRQLMARKLDTKPFGQRWQVETIFSMLKRRFGFVVHARRYWAQNREMLLMVLTYNLAIFLFVKELFYRAG